VNRAEGASFRVKVVLAFAWIALLVRMRLIQACRPSATATHAVRANIPPSRVLLLRRHAPTVVLVHIPQMALAETPWTAASFAWRAPTWTIPAVARPVPHCAPNAE